MGFNAKPGGHLVTVHFILALFKHIWAWLNLFSSIHHILYTGKIVVLAFLSQSGHLWRYLAMLTADANVRTPLMKEERLSKCYNAVKLALNEGSTLHINTNVPGFPSSVLLYSFGLNNVVSGKLLHCLKANLLLCSEMPVTLTSVDLSYSTFFYSV